MSRKQIISLLLISAGVILLAWRLNNPPIPEGSNLDPKQVRQLAKDLASLQQQEKEMERTVWKNEMLAQRTGSYFDQLWNRLLVVTNKLAAQDLEFSELIVPNFKVSELPGHQIEIRAGQGTNVLSREKFGALVGSLIQEGWEMARLEFRHNRFELSSLGLPFQSQYYFSADFTNSLTGVRSSIAGDVKVRWENERPKSIDASRLVLQQRTPAPAFELGIEAEAQPPDGSDFIDPIIIADLDGNGISEVIMVGANAVFSRDANGQLISRNLFDGVPGLIATAVVGDFDRDGILDLLCARFEGLVFFKGSQDGLFRGEGKVVWEANPHFAYAQVMTTGDVNADGDLDVWLGQYRVPYERGQMPSPYPDANDGNPSYLLLNDGQAQFTDATRSAGLEAKRLRRVYGGSLVDLNDDGSLDLLMVSDFAGLDVFRNDGKGHFQDVTAEWIENGRGFGMAHAIADFDNDERLDLFMIGMTSPIAERLTHLNLKRPGFEQMDGFRADLIHGNRLLARQGDARFRSSPLSESIRRSGWAWGCAAVDFDNDGFMDVYVANGHLSRSSAVDFEPEFWLHDIYVGNSKESILNAGYFNKKLALAGSSGISYGGHEKNRFFWNRGGTNFLETAQMFGIALPQDCRNALSEDLDQDGRADLIVTTHEVWPERKQTIKLYRNLITPTGDYLELRLVPSANSIPPAGCEIKLSTSHGLFRRLVLTGDSYRSQQAGILHFGLPKGTVVREVELKTPYGKQIILRTPAVNQLHSVPLPELAAFRGAGKPQ